MIDADRLIAEIDPPADDTADFDYPIVLDPTDDDSAGRASAHPCTYIALPDHERTPRALPAPGEPVVEFCVSIVAFLFAVVGSCWIARIERVPESVITAVSALFAIALCALFFWFVLRLTTAAYNWADRRSARRESLTK